MALPLLCHMSYWKDCPHHLTKYEGKGTSKIPIFKLFSELRKIWNGSLGYSKIPFHFFHELGMHSPRLIFQNPNFESTDEFGKVICIKLHC